MRLLKKKGTLVRLAIGLAGISLLVIAGCQAQPTPTPTTVPKAAPAAAPTKAPAAAPTAASVAPPKKASAEAWNPLKPVEFVVHTNPGDGADIFMRQIADIAQKEGGIQQPINVVNKVGGSGATMFGYVSSKAPDPHFLMPFQVSTITTPLRNKLNVSYKHFTPISLLATDEMIIAVRSDSPFANMKDLIDASKKSPKTVSQAGGVFGGSDSICGYLIEQAAGVKFNFISFKGSGEALVALLGGNADFFMGNPSEIIGQMEANQVRALAVASPQRLDALPDVPTLKEQGIDVVFQSFRGIATTKGVPTEAIATWEQVMKRVFDSEAFKKYLKDNALTGSYKNSAELGKYMDEQNAMYSRVLKEMGVLK